ncbi:hypothetical protein MKX01_002865 [Papaver californicum]|nr:hypothetical protein MKX01_002865 [Papaver californicum]
MTEQVQLPTTRDEAISLAVKESGKITPPKYPDAGQLYDEGKHRHDVRGQEYEDVGGFSVLNAQATFYKKIWLKYGHIASSHVLTSSLYSIQVMLVTDIMTFIMDMQYCCLSEVSSAAIDAWESKIKMAEKLEFNVRWLRDCFEDVKRYFDKEQKMMTTLLLEKDRAVEAAKARVLQAEGVLKMAREHMSAAEIDRRSIGTCIRKKVPA